MNPCDPGTSMPTSTMGRLFLPMAWFACLCMVFPSAEASEPVVCEAGSVVQVLQGEAGGWGLQRNGEPYFINGAGGQKHLDVLVAAGGNSIRTWAADHALEVLDRAAEYGVTVTVGFWLQHERHGFDYSDEQAVADQLELTRGYVQKLKDHPALLMWGVGNEVEGGGDNPLTWKAVNDIAEMIKQVDPNHPTMAVISEIPNVKLENFNRYCPAIDVLGVNSYGGLVSIAQRLNDAGFDRPYVVTEFGPLGQWEVGQTDWGVPIEQNSTEKSQFYEAGYLGSIGGQPGKCLGSYVFCWGTKQEVTPTWYSLFVGGQLTTSSLDVISKQWTGHWPDNRAPLIEPIESVVALKHVQAGAQYRANVSVVDPDGDALQYRWVVQSESSDRRSGGDHEATPPTHDDAVVSIEGNTVLFRAPDEPGGYRLFVYVLDGKGKVATANMPFYVDP